ncbi:AIPR family protein [Methanocalculus sp.]|uniref:AIPR family protein n=1 Tax=Methanocalculus sp. TaxID=2004547 RepID=UPI002624A2C1|nr:AIPR family protein [Methanocalculus sp.]MDG6249406.1 AIPR family protein [Methanocalculus sp.]
MSDQGFEQFSESFHQDIIFDSRDADAETFTEDKFTELMLEYMADAGEIDDREICSHQARGIKVNGYAFSSDNENLDLFVSHYQGESPPAKVAKKDILTQLRRLRTFFDRSVCRDYSTLEESSPAFDLADRIYQSRNELSLIRLFVLTDGVANVDVIEDDLVGPYRISHHVWDMQRLYRLWSSGSRPEPIEINFVDEFGGPIPCLPMPDENPVYSSYLCILSGDVLADMYGKFGPRLLERNVRAYLQMRGGVNKGIRNTIINDPHMFLAYNNGISTTAEDIDLIDIPGETLAISCIRDFQIVNGGQTTASIYHTRAKDKRDVSEVYVQVKLTVLKNPDDVDTIVPKISECANSQNKINAADFTSNDPFHIRIQKLSRSLWAPAKKGSQQETHWYYERVRGQYQDDKGREKTPKQRRIFGEKNPTGQRFTKTDLAKFENSWDQFPYIVSLGAEKNYREFIDRYKKHGEFYPDADYFGLLIAKAILFRRTDKIVQSLKYGGYKANIVTYTIALLSRHTNQRINLEDIWKKQELSPALEETIIDLSRIVHAHITNPPGGKNITEWCKKEDCWESLLKEKIDLPGVLKAELVDDDTVLARDFRAIVKLNETGALYSEQEPIVAAVCENPTREESIDYEDFIRNLTPQKWLKIIRNAAEAEIFSEEELALLRRMQKMSGRRMNPKKEQILQAGKILQTMAENTRTEEA